jgi:hypothetical protein
VIFSRTLCGFLFVTAGVLLLDRGRAPSGVGSVSPPSPPVLRGMTTTKREFIPAGDYVPLETKFGKVMVLPTDGEHLNVEVRAPVFFIDGIHFCFALTVCVTPGQKVLVGNLTEWTSGGTLTPRRKKLLLDEVTIRVLQAAHGPMAPAFANARKRVLHNNIRSVDEDVEKARKALEDLVAVRASLLEEESALAP